uniref:Uncharacterized protein n=1 Tax=Panagrolaimus sp. PS1159 TaxID=55785 RepID=A0AC35FRV5_9BILA
MKIKNNSFEFQRQQNDKIPEPELSQYKASKRLFNTASTQQQPGTSSAISQINQLRPIPGIDDVTDKTQRTHGPESTRKPVSVMKEIDPKSTRQNPLSPASTGSPASVVKDINRSQMGSVMGNTSVMGNASAMGSVIRPLEKSQHQKPHEELSDSTVFVKTKAVSRPAIVREPNNWVKKQNVDMTRALPLGIQPGDVDAKKLHSHTGVPSRISSNTAVSAAPASSPTPIQPIPDITTSREKSNPGKNKSNELFEPSQEKQQQQ